MKRYFVTLLTFSLCVSMALSVFAAEEYNLTEEDAVLLACMYLSETDEMVMPDDAEIVTPMYSEDGNIVAYYVGFVTDKYAVINNNEKYPVAIEFGEGSIEMVETASTMRSNTKIVYNNPENMYATNVSLMSNDEGESLYTYYPELAGENEEAERMLNELRNWKEKQVQSCETDNWGFMDSGDLPTGTYNGNSITRIDNIKWAITGDYKGSANSHCGAVAVTNLALIFANRGYSNLKVNGNVEDTFFDVHSIVGNGPKVTIADDAVEYFEKHGYTLNYKTVGNYIDYMTAIDNDRPCGVLVRIGLGEWHWILGIGYRKYATNDIYFQIQNGWDDTAQKYYLPHSGSTLVSMTEYWVG